MSSRRVRRDRADLPNRASILKLRSAYIGRGRHDVTVLARVPVTPGRRTPRNGTTPYTHRVVGWPSSDPLVTSVGGLQLHLNGQRQSDRSGQRLERQRAARQLAVRRRRRVSVFTRPAYQDSVRGIVGRRRGTLTSA